MQRNMDVVRQILLVIEQESGPTALSEPIITGVHAVEVNYHLKLLKQAGLIEAIELNGDDRTEYLQIGLTWKGHEFLAAARDEAVWRKAKATLGEKVSSVSLAVLQEVLTATMRSMLGLP